VVLVVVAYNRMRPGFTHWAGWLAVTMAPVTAASLGVTYFATGSFAKTYPGFDGTLVLFRLFECLYIALMIGWLALTLATIAAWLTGDWALRHVEPAIADDRPARGRWTARLTLSVATFAFATVTLIAWALINNGIAALVLPRMPYVPLLMFANGRTARDLTTFMANVTDYGGFSALLVLLAAGFVGALPALWGLGPVVWAEVRPPSFQASQGEYSRRLGRWLTLAFRGLRTSGRILYITTTWFVPLSVALIVLPALINLPLGEYQFLLKPLRYLGAFGGAFVIGLFMMRGQLKNALLGFRTTLDVMLDVDNWLREHPLEANPKARICGRYVSLLRYICDWRDPLDRTKKYDAIVFVTHSQGTVITADLLRFLKREARGNMQAYDPPLAELERPDMQVTLFTMGCPLRDLYGLRFPRLYGWTRHSDQAAMAAPSPPPDLLRNPQRGPQPSDLVAVKQWVNAYRSGDYIGRFLWRNDACSYAWDPNAVSADGVEREEFCIGAGAHTHYWDHTAPTIARRLNQLLG
jgi:hypothetical protein